MKVIEVKDQNVIEFKVKERFKRKRSLNNGIVIANNSNNNTVIKYHKERLFCKRSLRQTWSEIR